MERFCLKFFQKSIFFSEIAWVFSFRLFRLDLKLKPYGSRMSPKWYVDYLGISNGTPLDDQGFCLKLRREKQYEENACDFGEKIDYCISIATRNIAFSSEFQTQLFQDLPRPLLTFVRNWFPKVTLGSVRFQSVLELVYREFIQLTLWEW